MDKAKTVFMALRSLAAISLTGLGMIVLSTISGLTGFVIAIGLLYLALFASVSNHQLGR